MGMKTERLKVGTCVLLMPLHHPVHVAEDCAVIDQATKGRLVLSIGVGYQPHDFDAFEIPITERATRTEEAVDIIRKSWTGERFSFEGKHFHYQDTLITPGPSVNSPARRSGWRPGRRSGCAVRAGWQTAGSPTRCKAWGSLRTTPARYRAAAQKAGRKPYICLMRDAVLADSMADADAASEPTMYTHRFYFQYDAYVPDEHIKDVKTPEELTFATASKERLIVGSPEDCLEQLQMWKEAIQPDYLDYALSTAGRPVAREYAASHTHLWRKGDSEVVGRVSFSVTLSQGERGRKWGEGEDKMMEIPLTQHLAAFCTRLDYDRLPAEVVDRAKYFFLDYLGVAVRGSLSESSQPLYRLAGSLASTGRGNGPGPGGDSKLPVCRPGQRHVRA